MRFSRKNFEKRLRILSILVVGLVFGFGIYYSRIASSLTYQSRIGVNFTLDSSLSLTVSGDLLIDNLVPGIFSDSNTIQVTVNTNNAYGYKLTATVGNTNNSSSELRHTTYSTSGDPIFSSIALNADLARSTFSSGTTYDDKWGYSTNGTSYNGLPVEGSANEPVTILSSDYMPTNGTASSNFLIGAKASSNKTSGDYTNVINFYAVGNAGPMSLAESYRAAGKTKVNGYYKMQDMSDTTADICGNAEIEDDELQVIDTRDNKVYWIAKLKDGKCWMTQNLDLDLGTPTLTHNSTTLYHDDTDLGWGTDSATTSWTPANATIDVVYDNSMKGTFTSIGSDDTVPKSLDVGDWYYAGYDGTTLLASTTVNYLTSNNRTQSNGVTTVNNGSGVDYFSTAPFTGTGTSNNGEHGHVGNYYNWTAAIASNDSSGYTTSTYDNVSNNPQNSICPAGWRLPTKTNASPDYTNADTKREFQRLVYLYNNNNYETSSSAKLELAPLYFVRSGNVSGSTVGYAGNYSQYWSSSVNSSSYAYYFRFAATYVSSGDASFRNYGRSVRCVAR